MSTHDEEYELRSPDAMTYDPELDARIVSWRARCFERLGLQPLHVTVLAIRRDVDRHTVERLVDLGADSGQVAGILLGPEGAPPLVVAGHTVAWPHGSGVRPGSAGSAACP
jgi:hypothetical protein